VSVAQAAGDGQRYPCARFSKVIIDLTEHSFGGGFHIAFKVNNEAWVDDISVILASFMEIECADNPFQRLGFISGGEMNLFRYLMLLHLGWLKGAAV
jgi:hypothetical protein